MVAGPKDFCTHCLFKVNGEWNTNFIFCFECLKNIDNLCFCHDCLRAIFKKRPRHSNVYKLRNKWLRKKVILWCDECEKIMDKVGVTSNNN